MASSATADRTDRRMLRRFPNGIGAELAVGGHPWPCRITDLSLGEAVVRGDGATMMEVMTSGPAELRALEIGDGEPIAAEVRRVDGVSVHLALRHNPDSEFCLTMFLIEGPLPVGF